MSAPRKFKLLDLFSGIGGFSLGLERTGGFETVAFCEIAEFPRRVLAKHWPGVPIYDDVRGLSAERLARDGIAVDAVCGGFPCQDISSAGRKGGIGGERSGLWAEYSRLIREIRPRYVIVENVAALLARGLERVLGDLAESGYDAEWRGIPASAVGAPHARDRVWIVAYPHDGCEPVGALNDETRRLSANDAASDAERGVAPQRLHLAGTWGKFESVSWDRVWPGQNTPLGMGVDDGLPERLDRCAALGNAVVPQIPELIGRAILAAEAA